MPNILTNLNKQDGEKSKFKFIAILLTIFIVFAAVGYFVVVLFVPTSSDKMEEFPKSTTISGSGQPRMQSEEYKGYVKFIDPYFYPNDEISFVLNDQGGSEIILLKTDDQKLQVAEGHYVTAKGKVRASEFGDYNYLLVDEVVIENVTN